MFPLHTHFQSTLTLSPLLLLFYPTIGLSLLYKCTTTPPPTTHLFPLTCIRAYLLPVPLTVRTNFCTTYHTLLSQTWTKHSPLFHSAPYTCFCPPDCCTQTDLKFLDNPISFPPPPQTHLSRRETRPAAGRRSSLITTSNILTSPHVIESPLFDQIREQIYSEVASLVSENKLRPYYLLELFRATLTTWDRLDSTLSTVSLITTSTLRPSQAFRLLLASLSLPLFPSPYLSALFPPDTQLAQKEEEEGVYSPTQNLPLVRHYLKTDQSGTSENVDDACQLSDAPQAAYS